MTIHQEQEMPLAATAASKKNANTPSRKVWLALFMGVSVIAFLWLSFWPQLEGTYVGNAGKTKIEVATEATGTYVTISDDTSGTTKVSVFEAEKAKYTLRFGSGLEQQAIVYHPLGNDHYELVTGGGSIALTKQSWMSRLAVAHPYAALTAIMASMIAYMFYVLKEKAKTEPEVIHPMWLAYFGALFGSAGILIAAGENGIFGVNGKPLTDVARAILKAAEFFLNLGPELWGLLGLLAFVSLTQYFAYGFSGLSGAAQRPRYIVLIWKVVTLLIAKAFIGASAVVLSIEIIGSQFDWVNTEPRNLAANVALSIMSLFFGLLVFCVVPLKSGVGKPVGKRVRRLHRWMRRRMRKGPNQVTVRLQKQAALKFPWQF